MIKIGGWMSDMRFMILMSIRRLYTPLTKRKPMSRRTCMKSIQRGDMHTMAVGAESQGSKSPQIKDGHGDWHRSYIRKTLTDIWLMRTWNYLVESWICQIGILVSVGVSGASNSLSSNLARQTILLFEQWTKR